MKTVSISKLGTFKACRRMYELKYIEGLKSDAVSNALQIGANYHELLAQSNKTKFIPVDFDKATAMATAYSKYIKPELGVLKNVETWIEQVITDDYKLVGVLDGMTQDGILVEHKTTSLSLEEFEYNLQWDEQMLAYMLMTGARSIIYSVVKKPTIRQRKTETEEQFFDRMVKWYDEETDKKIAMIYQERSDAEVEQFRKQLVRMTKEMETDNFYRNTSYCRSWGRMCEYAPMCLKYNPDEEYFGFTKEIRNEN